MYVLGIEPCSFNIDGKEYHGTRLHLGVRDKNTLGMKVLKPIYCSEKVDISSVALGDNIRILYNQWNKPERVEIDDDPFDLNALFS